MQLLAIIQNTLKETIRNKILYNVIFFVLGLMFLSVIVSTWSYGQEAKILKDFALSIISIFGLLIAIFIGIGLVYKEIDKHTIYTILAKPVSRYQFLLGKYLGLILAMFINFAVMTAALYVIMFVFANEFDLSLLFAILMIFFEMSIIVVVAIFFSSFTTPTLSAIFSLAVYVGGHLSHEAKTLFLEKQGQLLKIIIDIFYYIFPNLAKFNYKTEIVHNLPVNPGNAVMAMVYGIFYITVVLLLSTAIFNKRDFK